MNKEAVVIGGGFSGLSAAAYLAKAGFNTTLLEKLAKPGGRAQQLKNSGYTFDLGPSWYWMPEIFDNFFQDFQKDRKDYYTISRLDPSYSVIFHEGTKIKLPAETETLNQLFDSIEPGSSISLREFLKDARRKYELGMDKFIHLPGLSVFEYFKKEILLNFMKLDLFKSVQKEIRSKFKNEQLRQILEFPVLFLGGTPWSTPALYTMMNYADMGLGTWHVSGGMQKVAEGMADVASDEGAELRYSEEVIGIKFSGDRIEKIETNSGSYRADVVINTADYHFFEQKLLPKEFRRYSEKYWEKRTLAPSAILYHLGLTEKVSLEHHTLFFDAPFEEHARDIYETGNWPKRPLFYVSVPSKTDNSLAPEGKEVMTILIPISPGLEPDQKVFNSYFSQVMERISSTQGSDLKNKIECRSDFGPQDFKRMYYAYKGNAYGLANTLFQTGPFKPKMKSSEVQNLYYAGQLTVPGPGVPPAIISGRIAAELACQE